MARRLVFAFLLILPLFAQAADEKLAFIYYYGWYGNPEWDSQWLHWQEYNHRPPRDISSAYYPDLGAYSSRDPAVLEQHIRWIAGANINVIIYSWWGRGDPTDDAAPPLLDMAADYSLKVTFLIEPYAGRTTDSICDDIEYLMDRFGRHPAFFKMTRKADGASTVRRGLFLLYQPEYPEADLLRLAERVQNSPGKPILLLQSTDVGLARRVRADGLFAYEAYQNLQHFYEGLVKSANAAGLIFIPCVSPGFNVNRTLNIRSEIFRPRRLGRTYDDWWESVLASETKLVAIISFNEWHEGTQIEPAARVSIPGQLYLSYENSYGKQGAAAAHSYLRRTARWIQLFQKGEIVD